MTKRYWKVMLGESNKLIRQASKCFKDGYIGIDFLDDEELTKAVIEMKAGDKKITKGAKVACNNLLSEMSIDDIVVCPDGYGNYAVGIIDDEYKFEYKKLPFPHMRKVNWQLGDGDVRKGIPKSKICPELNRLLSARSGTIKDITKSLTENDRRLQKKFEELYSENHVRSKGIHWAELNTGVIAPSERILGNCILKNWKSFDLGKEYALFDNNQANHAGHEMLKVLESSKTPAREYQTPVGNIDILAIKNNGKEYLVIELKKSDSSDAVGQVIRYMGYLKSATNDGAKIKGCIIGHGEDDHTLSTLEAINAFSGSGSIDIDFYSYEMTLSKDEKEIIELRMRKVDIPRKITCNKRL